MTDTRLNVRIDAGLDEALKIAVARRRTTKQAAAAEALQTWIEGGKVEVGDFGTLTDQEYRYLHALLDILRAKPKFGLQGITGALDAWLIDHPVETRPHDSKRRKSSGH